MAGNTEAYRLISELSDWDWEKRMGAANALGNLGDKSAVPGLIDALSDSHENVRFHAAFALGYFGDTFAVPALIEALSGSDDDVRALAAQSLGKLGDRSAVPALIEALSDPEINASRALFELDIYAPSLLRVSFSTPGTQFVFEEFSKSQGLVSNVGKGPAFNISLSISGRAAGHVQHVEVSDEVKPGTSTPWFVGSFLFSLSPAVPPCLLTGN